MAVITKHTISMNTLQIQNNLNKKENIAIGIDFGTTNSAICMVFGYTHTMLAINQGRNLIKSDLYFSNCGKVFLENEIPDKKAKLNYIKLPSLKRLIDKSIADIKDWGIYEDILPLIKEKNGKILIEAFNKIYSIPELISFILKYLKKETENITKQEIHECVISVPAYFSNRAKGVIMQAMALSNLEVIRLIAEPTAAAYAYNLSYQKKGTYLVYDLGGGTFDASLIKIQEGILKVVGVIGNTMLGGDDFDLEIAKLLEKKYQIHKNKCIAIAKKLKENINNKEEITILDDVFNCKFSLSKDELKEQVNPLIQQTIKLIKQLLIEQSPEDLKGIVLVGGSTKLNLIKETLETLNYPILSDINPDEAVAIGAAYQANNLINKTKNLLMDVVPLSLGVELADGLVERIIPRNSPIPITGYANFTTSEYNQRGIKFHIVQGEREFAKDCYSLARFELTSLPVKRAGELKVELKFALDANGILSVSSMEKEYGIFEEITVNPISQLAPEKLSTHTTEVLNNLEVDYTNKKLQLEINYINKLFIAIDKICNSLNSNEQEILKINKNNLKEALRSKEVNQIEKALKAFENYALPILEDEINRSLSSHLLGKKILP
jgi:molecular chaperone HscA